MRETFSQSFLVYLKQTRNDLRRLQPVTSVSFRFEDLHDAAHAASPAWIISHASLSILIGHDVIVLGLQDTQDRLLQTAEKLSHLIPDERNTYTSNVQVRPLQ